MSILDEFWGEPYPYGPKQPPASSEDIRHWEEKYGVSLPPTLSAALMAQNGGDVLRTDILIYPLPQIVPLSDERWAHIWRFGDQPEFGPPSRLVMFGIYNGVAGSLILNYNAGPEPRVIILWHDMGDELEDKGNGSFDDLIRSERGG